MKSRSTPVTLVQFAPHKFERPPCLYYWL